jgi:hypothetical protein
MKKTRQVVILNPDGRDLKCPFQIDPKWIVPSSQLPVEIKKINPNNKINLW